PMTLLPVSCLERLDDLRLDPPPVAHGVPVGVGPVTDGIALLLAHLVRGGRGTLGGFGRLPGRRQGRVRGFCRRRGLEVGLEDLVELGLRLLAEVDLEVFTAQAKGDRSALALFYLFAGKIIYQDVALGHG